MQGYVDVDANYKVASIMCMHAQEHVDYHTWTTLRQVTLQINS
jgi:uncharacterized protein YuzE